jgi:NhaC family Na+:H+ antiporter
MAGTDLFTHIKYMSYTTIPTILVTLIIFVIIGLNLDITGTPQIQDKLDAIDGAFNISPWLFIVPVFVIFMIIRKTPPLIALLFGALLGGIVAIIAQPEIIIKIAGATELTFQSAYKGVMNALTVDTAVETSSKELNDLFTAGGMKGMLGTIWLIVCAMVFGGVMDAIGALARITDALLKMATSVFGLFASTVASCLALNLTASDQYLALVIPGKMFKKAYEDRGLAPENLSRTLEDSGTVTSVLIPWNTCGAYHSKVLFGYAGATAYIPYVFFSILSPFTTLLFAALNIKIKQLAKK